MNDPGMEVRSLQQYGKTTVLLYHRILRNDKATVSSKWTVSESRFREQLDFLDKRGYSSITFEDYRLALQGELRLPMKPVIITFDGSCKDTYEIAFPILQKYGMRAVVFAIANPDTMKDMPEQQQRPSALLRKEHILEMHAEGFEIGAHPFSHTDLTLLNEKDARDEVSRSRMLLEIMLNAPVKSFSFPLGQLNDLTKRIVAEAGYANACGMWSGPATFFADPFEIRRTVVLGTTTMLGFAMRILLPYEHYGWLLWQLRKLRGRTNKEEPIVE